MTTTAASHPHATWCRPRPGEDEQRTESYRLPKYDPDGLNIIGMAHVRRCLECGSHVVDGVLRD